MAYETLINSTSIAGKPANKPHYTPAKSLKHALKLIRKFFKRSPKHAEILNESVLETTFVSEYPAEWDYASEEECDNFANERLEAAAADN